jgi:hypothetical protein
MSRTLLDLSDLLRDTLQFGQWWVLPGKRELDEERFSDEADRRYVLIDHQPGPAVTLLPRSTKPPRRVSPPAFEHARHNCSPPCWIDDDGFILRRPCSFEVGELTGDRYSCLEGDEETLAWLRAT